MDEITQRDRGRPADAGATDFNEVAARFLDERGRGEGGTLPRYIEEHPGMAADLLLLTVETELARAETAMGTGAGATNAALSTIPPALLARLRADAHRILTPQVVAACAAPTPAPAPAPARAIAPLVERLSGSFAQEARKRAGLTPRALVACLGVGADIVSMLDEGDIRPETVPPTLVERLATALKTTADAVYAALAAPRTGLTAYHAPRGHTARRRISFDEAIRLSPTMTDAQKDMWRAGGGHSDADTPTTGTSATPGEA